MSPGHKREDSQSSYYFVSHEAGTSNATRDVGDETAVIESLPPGFHAENFAPRAIDDHNSVRSSLHSMPTTSLKSRDSSGKTRTTSNNNPLGFLSHWLFGSTNNNNSVPVMDLSGAVKVEPKVFFAAERTFLAWMHASILLAGVSVAISAYAETGSASDIYGVMILPIAIVFMVYAMIQYGDRSLKIRKRSPGPYEDRWGPVVLGSIFAAAIVAEFLVKLFETTA